LATEIELMDSPQPDLEYHRRTYRAFVRGVVLFTVHTAAILLILAYVFSDSMG
jgi:hypothetical protein